MFKPFKEVKWIKLFKSLWASALRWAQGRRILFGRKRETAAAVASPALESSGVPPAGESSAGSVSKITKIDSEIREARRKIRAEWSGGPRQVCPRCSKPRTFQEWRDGKCFLGTCAKPGPRFHRARATNTTEEATNG